MPFQVEDATVILFLLHSHSAKRVMNKSLPVYSLQNYFVR